MFGYCASAFLALRLEESAVRLDTEDPNPALTSQNIIVSQHVLLAIPQINVTSKGTKDKYLMKIVGFKKDPGWKA
jgi:hypothetical protein